MQSHDRRGTTLIVSMALLAVISALGASMLRTAYVSNQQLKREILRSQTILLAESGVTRGLSRRMESAEYKGEIWKTNPGDLEGNHTASIHIKVEEDPQKENKIVVSATASYPEGSPTAVRSTTRIVISR